MPRRGSSSYAVCMASKRSAKFARQPTILVVDQMPEAVCSTCGQLEDAGYETLGAFTLAMARLAWVASRPTPDVIVIGSVSRSAED